MGAKKKVRLASIGAGMIGHVHAGFAATMKECEYVALCDEDPAKAEMAKETFRLAKVENEIEFIFGDALDYISDYDNIAFCFLDAEKEVYNECYDMVLPNMISGAIMVIDNVISHKSELEQFIKKVEADSRVDSVIIPIGKGELLCRRR